MFVHNVGDSGQTLEQRTVRFAVAVAGRAEEIGPHRAEQKTLREHRTVGSAEAVADRAE